MMVTDEELKQQLRDSKGWPRLGDAAADLIEELEAKLAKAMETLNAVTLTIMEYNMRYGINDGHNDLTDEISSTLAGETKE